MKSPVILKAIVSVLLVAFPFAQADAVELTLTPRYNIYDSDCLEDRAGVGLGISYKDYFLNLSYEKAFLRVGGWQETADAQLYGLSVCYQRELIDSVEGFVSFGLYYPSVETREAYLGDGFWYAFGDALSTDYSTVRQWEHADYDLRHSFGCTIGLNYVYDISDWGSLKFGISRRWLRLTEQLYAWNGTFDPSAPHWQVFRPRSFGALQINLGVEIRF